MAWQGGAEAPQHFACQLLSRSGQQLWLLQEQPVSVLVHCLLVCRMQLAAGTRGPLDGARDLERVSPLTCRARRGALAHPPYIDVPLVTSGHVDHFRNLRSVHCRIGVCALCGCTIADCQRACALVLADHLGLTHVVACRKASRIPAARLQLAEGRGPCREDSVVGCPPIWVDCVSSLGLQGLDTHPLGRLLPWRCPPYCRRFRPTAVPLRPMPLRTYRSVQ